MFGNDRIREGIPNLDTFVRLLIREDIPDETFVLILRNYVRYLDNTPEDERWPNIDGDYWISRAFEIIHRQQ